MNKPQASWLTRLTHNRAQRRQRRREQLLSRLTDGQYTEILEGMQEATNWLLERTKEDLTWKRLSGGAQQSRTDVHDREETMVWSRWAFKGGDPYIKRCVWCITEFCFGNGIDGPLGEDIQMLEDFWKNDRNQQVMFSTRAQYKRSNQLLVDGELFLVLFTAPDGTVQVRPLEPLIITDIIAHPDDPTIPLYYKREIQEQKWDASLHKFVPVGSDKKVVYYPDWQNDEDSNEHEDPLRAEMAGRLAGDDICILHVPLNTVEDAAFGIPETAASLKWAVQTKEIAEDQATISRMTAALMILARVQGSQQDIDGLVDQIKSMTGGEQPPPVAGSMNMFSPAIDLQVNRALSNASDARVNSRLMRMALTAGMGLTLHYASDPENANLATATSMELPVMRHMTAYQALWVGIYSDLFRFVLRKAKVIEEPDWELPVPRMIEPDITGTAGAIDKAYTGGLILPEHASTAYLNILGFDYVGREVERVLKYREQQEAEAMEEYGEILDEEEEEEEEGPEETE